MGTKVVDFFVSLLTAGTTAFIMVLLRDNWDQLTTEFGLMIVLAAIGVIILFIAGGSSYVGSRARRTIGP